MDGKRGIPPGGGVFSPKPGGPAGSRDMGCLKGRKKAKEKPGNYTCKRCGAVSKKKGDLCKPKKIK